MKRNQSAYLAKYYEKNRAAIREKQRESYEAKYEIVSSEVLAHLRAKPVHALGAAEICADCERLGPFSVVVCLECGRAGLAQLAIHLNVSHKLSRHAYLEKWNLNRGTSLASPKFRETKARPANLHGGMPFTAETARRVNLGRRWTSREKRRVIGSKRHQPITALSRRLLASGVSDWAVAQRRLQGMENRAIALELKISSALVNRRCKALGFPRGEAARFWRGDPVGDRCLRDMLRDGALTVQDAAQRMGVKPHRISRALARAGRALPLDLGSAVVSQLAQLKQNLQGPGKLLEYERRELHWKASLVRREIRAIHSELKRHPSMKLDEALCRLARNGSVTVLFRWGREFLEWISQQCNPGAVRHELSRAFEVARDFLASEYGVSSETVRRVILEMKTAAPNREALQHRRALLDLRTAFGDRRKIPTAELFSQLKNLGRAPWTKLGSEKRLGGILGVMGMKSRNIWMSDGRVLKGYSRSDLRVYSTVEVARLLGVATITMKHYAWKKAIPLPPLVARAGVRGAGRIRVWTERDIEAAKRALDLRTPKHRRPGRSARRGR